ncbi:MAG: AN1-type zinc finger protein [Candidatus Hodarchaeales archaeon]|jgi:hypothetical protein
MSLSRGITRAGLIYLIGLIFFISSYLLLSLLTPELLVELINWYIFFFGIFSLLYSLFILRALFRSLKVITGTGKIVHLSPDLKITSVKDDPSVKKIEMPETGTCTSCGKNVFKPFICQDCKQLFCGKHVLSGDHDCQEREVNY